MLHPHLNAAHWSVVWTSPALQSSSVLAVYAPQCRCISLVKIDLFDPGSNCANQVQIHAHDDHCSTLQEKAKRYDELNDEEGEDESTDDDEDDDEYGDELSRVIDDENWEDIPEEFKAIITPPPPSEDLSLVDVEQAV